MNKRREFIAECGTGFLMLVAMIGMFVTLCIG